MRATKNGITAAKSSQNRSKSDETEAPLAVGYETAEMAPLAALALQALGKHAGLTHSGRGGRAARRHDTGGACGT